MAVRTLFKDKALRDQAFECLPEERQEAISCAVARGEEMSWEEEGWEALIATQRVVLREKETITPCAVAPTPEESEWVWYDWTKARHPTLSPDEAWRLAITTRSESGGSPSMTGNGEASGSASSARAAPPSQNKALEEWRCPLVPITVEQGIRDYVKRHGADAQTAVAIADQYSSLAISYGHAQNHRAREALTSPVMQLVGPRQDQVVQSGTGCSRCGRLLLSPSGEVKVASGSVWDVTLGPNRMCGQIPLCQDCTKPPWSGALAQLPNIPTPDVSVPQSQPPRQPQSPSPPEEPEDNCPSPRRPSEQQQEQAEHQAEKDQQRADYTKLKELEAEDRLLLSLRKIRDRITTYTCPTDNPSGDRPSGHLLVPLKKFMRELQDHFKEALVKRALTKKKSSDDGDLEGATITTVPEELRPIIRDRVEGSAQGVLNQKVLANQMLSLDDLVGTLARACVSDAHLSILPNMLSRARQASGRNAGRNAATFHHSLMESFDMLDMLHNHGVTGPVRRAALPGIFLSGLTPELHARVHKELVGKVDFNQSSGKEGWEAELLRKYVEQATLEERRDPVAMKTARDQSPFPIAPLMEFLEETEPPMELCYAVPAAAAAGPVVVEGRQLPGSSVYTGCRKCKSKEHLARDCPQQHHPQQKAAWVKCIWEETFETFQNAGMDTGEGGIVEQQLALVAPLHMDFAAGEQTGAGPSPRQSG